MIKIRVMIIALLFAILGSPIAAIASDVTNALYSGTIVVSNNSTATTNVATVANISTDNLIAGQYLNATANNTVMRNSSGADVSFMPGYTPSNAFWSMWVPSIGANSYFTYILYTANSTGGEIRYFPGATGMTTTDDAGLELLGLSTNFSIVQRGWLDTAATGTSYTVNKTRAIEVRTGDVSGNLTARVYDWDFAWGFDDPAVNWALETNAYDDDVSTQAFCSDGGVGWQSWLYLEQYAPYASEVRLWVDDAVTSPDITQVDLDVYYDGAWTDLYTGVFVEDAWIYYDLGSVYMVERIRLRFWNQVVGGRQVALAEIEPGGWRWDTTALGVSTGEHTVTTALEPEPAMSTWANDVNIGVNMGNGILPVKVLEEITLDAPAASVTFSGITGNVTLWDSLAGITSRHLVVMVNAKSPDAVAQRNVLLQFNGDTGNNYNYQYIEGENAVASASRVSGQASSLLFPISGTTYVNAFNGGTVLIPHAFNTVDHKAILSMGGASEDEIEAVFGRWASISAVTSILLQPSVGNFDIGSTFILGVVDERYLVEEAINPGADFLPDFQNIPQDGHDLVVIGYLRSDRANATDTITQQINNDGGVNYWRQRIVGTFAVAAQQGNDSQIGTCVADTSDANTFGAVLVHYQQYSEAINHSHILALSGWHGGGGGGQIRIDSARWSNVAAIDRLEYIPGAGGVNWKAGSLFSLYRVPRYVIDRQELTVATPTITFNNIPQNYQALQLNVYARSSDAIPISDDVAITLNTDAGPATFDWQYLEGTGAGPPTALRNLASNVLMTIPAAGEGANEFGGGTTTFNQYTNTLGHKHFMTISGTNENQVIIRSSRWEDTDAITRIDLDPVNGVNFVIGSVFELVGLMPTQVLDIEVDGEIKGIADGNIAVPDTADDWVFTEAAAMPYMEYHRITINGTLQQDIAWEYDSIFHDTSYYGVEFDGVNDLINVGNAATMQTTAPLTILAWVNLKASGGNHNLVARRQGADNFWFWNMNADKMSFDFRSGGVLKSPGVADTALSVDTWYLIGVTYDLANVIYYHNGVEDGIKPIVGQIDITATATTIGAGNAGGFQSWDGIIDEVLMYNRVLTPAEILYNYNAGAGAYTPFDTTGLVGWWHLEEGTDITATDSSGNGNDGTLTNNPRWVNGHVPLPFGTSGTNDATPSFRTASSDADVSANMTSFLPISQAQAPAYALGAVNPFITGTGNVTGNFTTVPLAPPGGFPLAGVIATIANATSTPPQLPLLIIAGFAILAASLTTSSLLRRYGSGTLLIKAFVIIGFMGVFISLGNFGIDFWMLVIFAIIATALAMMSKQISWS